MNFNVGIIVLYKSPAGTGRLTKHLKDVRIDGRLPLKDSYAQVTSHVQEHCARENMAYLSHHICHLVPA